MRLFALATLFALLPLAGCATYTGPVQGKPEVVYKSSQEPGLKIVRQSTAHYYEVFTADGNHSYPRRYDHRYSWQNPDGTTAGLPFLDVQGDSPNGKGVVSAVFDIGGKDAWVALSEQFSSGYSLAYSHDSGWYDNGIRRRDLTAKIFVKSFDKTRLLHEAELDVCNPSNAANPPIQFDVPNAALRYCDREGIRLYFPLTGERRLERTALCCHDSSAMQSRRDRKDYYQRTGG